MAMETKPHKEIKELIGKLLKGAGYKTEVEHRIGKNHYDVVVWDRNNGKKIFVEVYTYPPRIDVEPPNVVCNICDYAWFTRSEKDFVTCPNCQRKVKKEGDSK